MQIQKIKENNSYVLSQSEGQAPSPERVSSKQKRKAFNSRFVRGQVMMIVVMVLSAVMIGATGIAGILTARQIRQTADAGNFSKVLFAADSGLEWGNYRFKNDGGTCQYINNNNCPDESCEPKPSLDSINIELNVACEPMIEVGSKICPDSYDCWTITSSATRDKGIASKEISYIFSKDYKMERE